MSDSEMQKLIDEPIESEFTEIKNWLGGLAKREAQAKLAKEIIALANSGGGRILIGFADDKGQSYPAIEPEGDEATAFTQEKISGIVHKYCTPPIQCSVEFYCQTGRKIRHPVITVPAGGRVPVFAAKQGPDNCNLEQGKVYVRRTGGYSEPCRIQDDWERLLERLVLARQDELLDAIRKALNPDQGFMRTEIKIAFDEWLAESRAARNKVLDALLVPEGHSLRLEHGNYEIAFSITPFRKPDIAELIQNLRYKRPKYSGWPPFVCLTREDKKPQPMGKVIQAWLVGDEGLESDPAYSDFWRISAEGHGYLIRGMQEDSPELSDNRMSPPSSLNFDWELPIYRVTEILKFIEWLGRTYSTLDAEFQMQVIYNGTEKRRLQNRNWLYALDSGGMAHQDPIPSQISGSIEDIALNLKDLVFSLLRPVYSQFDFAELPRILVDDVVQKALKNRR